LKSGAKIFLWVTGGVVAVGGGALGILYAGFEPEIVPDSYFLGGEELKGNKAAVKLAVSDWFAKYGDKKIELSGKGYGNKKFSTSLSEMGCSVDAGKEANQVAYQDFFTHLIGGYKNYQGSTLEVEPDIRCELTKLGDLKAFVQKYKPEIGSAKAKFEGGKVQLTYEQVSNELDDAKVEGALLAAAKADAVGEIPFTHAPKQVPDEELEKITTVMSEFKTSFNAGKISRSANIRLAASRINGLVLMPGESFSFNDYLGQRTQAKGFKVAGVYVSGRHDVDVGGGICQVSTTLYNAAVRGDVKINSRSPHSLPVPYVPLGQDAAVSFPNPDLKITNEHDFPIALAATPEKSQLTFRILGPGKAEYTYKFESQLISSWSRGEKIVHNPSLAYGVRKVTDSGGSGRKVRTWKLTYKDGKLVKRENMGDSTYSGGPRIIEMNKSAKPSAPKTVVKPDAPVQSLPVNEGD
jgi:vancomycin resistance protein YoaR